MAYLCMGAVLRPNEDFLFRKFSVIVGQEFAQSELCSNAKISHLKSLFKPKKSDMCSKKSNDFKIECTDF